jgi:hypothetical protein
MKKAITIVILSVFLLSFFLPIFPVNSTEYNWIDNNSFEDASRFIANGNFENGNVSWTFESICFVSDTEPHVGDYHCQLGDLGYGLYQSLTTNVSITDFISLNFYAKKTAGDTHRISYIISYENSSGTHSQIYDETLSEDYTYYSNDFSEILNLGGETSIIYKIEFNHAQGSTWIYLDEVELVVEGYGTGTGQTTIEADTEPWYSLWYSMYSENYIGLTNDYAYDGNYSAYLTWINQDRTNMISLYQRVNYMLTNNLTSISFYAKTDSDSNVIIEFQAFLSDGQSAIVNSLGTDLNSSSGWVNIEIPLWYINSNKLITRIGFRIIGGDYGDFTYIDYIEVNSSVSPTVGRRFYFYLIPETIPVSNQHVRASIDVKYKFYGFWYNESGVLADSGIYEVESDRGILSGTVSYGQFTFDITARDKINMQTTETFEITLDIDGYGIFTVNIYISWDFSPTVTPPPEGFDENEELTNDLVRWIIMFVVIFMPAILFAGGIYENNQRRGNIKINPIFGLIAGLVLSIGLGVYTSLIPPWILILMIVCVGILIASMVVSR